MERSRRAPPRGERWRFMVYGALFGAAFPVIATFMAAHHATLLGIVYSAPLICGGMGFLIGRERERLVTTLKTLDDQVGHRTEELRRARDAADRIRAAIHESVLVLDPNGRLTSANAAACALLGRDEATLLGTPFTSLLACSGPAAPCNPVAEVLDGVGPESEAREVELLAGDGTVVPTIFSASTVRDEEGRLEAVICIAHDIRARRAAESRARHQDKLETIGRLAAGIAHEINTPVQYISDNARFLDRAFTKIVGALETCRRIADADAPCDEDARARARRAFEEAKIDFLVEQVPSALEQTREGLERVSRIVAAMKDFSHPSDGERQPADIASLLRTAITVCRNEWKYLAEVTVEAPEHLPEVPCVRDELSQVILNLVVNAAQAIGEQGREARGRIDLTVREATLEGGPAVEIRVADDGPGIPPENLARVFDPFFTTKEVGKGTGQGLAIAHQVVVERHGGTLDVASTPGEGTVFTIRLPLAAADGEERPAANAAEPAVADRAVAA